MSELISLSDERHQIKISHEDGVIYIREGFGDAVMLTLQEKSLVALSQVIDSILAEAQE